jgi:hypothetical protein
MAITFTRLKEYLDAIAAKANLNPADAAHGVFWDTTYDVFKTGAVPHKRCRGEIVPILDPANKVNSAFYQILRGGWCSMPQMPRTGPYLTDEGYSVTLNDKTIVTGAQILHDIEEWLHAGAPENG